MYIIYDKNTNEIKQTIDKNYGIKTSEDEVLQEVTQEFMNKYLTAYDYDLVFDENKVVVDVNVIKTWEQWKQKQPTPEPQPTQEDYMIDLDFRLSKIELGI